MAKRAAKRSRKASSRFKKSIKRAKSVRPSKSTDKNRSTPPPNDIVSEETEETMESPNAPDSRKPPSTNCYTLFLKDYRKKNPKIKYWVDSARKKWRRISEKNKESWKERAREINANNKLPPISNPYVLFCKDYALKNHQDPSNPDFCSMKSEDIGRAWNKLSKEEKELWKERSRTLDLEHDGRLYEQLQSPRKKKNSKRQTMAEDMEMDDEDDVPCTISLPQHEPDRLQESQSTDGALVTLIGSESNFQNTSSISEEQQIELVMPRPVRPNHQWTTFLDNFNIRSPPVASEVYPESVPFPPPAMSLETMIALLEPDISLDILDPCSRTRAIIDRTFNAIFDPPFSSDPLFPSDPLLDLNLSMF